MTPDAPSSASTGPEGALGRALACPLNEPAWVDAAADALRGTDPHATAAQFSAGRPLPRLTPFFDAAFYLDRNADVAAAGMEPYLHFLDHGIREGRDPHPLVDLALVASQLETPVEALDPQVLARALADAGVRPHPLFEPAAYLDENPDVREAGMPALRHYLLHGAGEGRRPNPAFDPGWYRAQYLDADASLYDAFRHFVTEGQARGNSPSPGPGDAAPSDAPQRAGGHGAEARGDAEDRGTAAAAPPQLVEGFLDAVRGHVAHGWAWSPATPDRALEIEIVDDHRVVGRGPAGTFREDLEAHGFGDGRHAFRLKLSRELDDGRPHLLKARVAGTDRFLEGEAAYEAAPAAGGEHDPIPAVAVPGLARRVADGWGGPEAEAEAFTEAASAANLLLETGDFEAALAAIEAAAARFPANPLLALQAAEACTGIGRADLAIGHCRRAVDLAGQGDLAARALLALGNASRVLGQWQEAGQAYRAALERDPGLAAARRRLDGVEDRNRLLDARRRLAEGDGAGALPLLVPQLVRRPHDPTLQRLVDKAATHDPDAERHLDADARRAIAAVRLLRAVTDHVRTHGVTG